MTYALTITVDLPFDAALEATREALARSGFGVVSDIDMQETFGAKPRRLSCGRARRLQDPGCVQPPPGTEGTEQRA